MHHKKIIYLNCTAIMPHIGCMAVTDFHLRSILENGFDVVDIVYSNFPWRSLWLGEKSVSIESCLKSDLGDRLSKADIVVINGEGTLHHGPGMGIMVAVAAAHKLGKPVHLVNTSIFAIDGFDDVFADLADLNVREMESSELLKKRGIPHRVVLDSFLGADFSTVAKSDYSGKTVVMDWHPGRDKDVGRATLDYYASLPFNNARFLPLNHYSHVNTWRHTVADLATANLIVTGRYHGVYLAGLAGKAFVALPSNTRKIQGLIQASGIPLPLCENYVELETSTKFALSNPSLFLEFKAFLKQQLPLGTFSPMAASGHEESSSASTTDLNHALHQLENQIESARLEAQYLGILAQNKTRVEMTHLRQLQKIGMMGFHKLRRKIGL